MALNIVEKIDDRVALKHVLMSVSDKTGLDTLAQGLVQNCPDIKIYSTGGTYRALQKIFTAAQAHQHLVAVSDYTGQPEMQGGLVKTLDFKIYLGLLSETYNADHQQDLQRVAAVPLDMVVVNLYPFQATVARADVTPEQARTNIDIGGPCMIRASAKNYLRVASVTDPADYPVLVQELARQQGRLSLAARFHFMQKAFAHTAAYDSAIMAYFARQQAEVVQAGYVCQNNFKVHP